MKLRRWWIVLLATPALLAPAATARADEARTVAFWAMDEPAGVVMYDRSGNGLHGRIGHEVGLGDGTYRFDRLEPDTPPARPQHVVAVPDYDELDPGERTFLIAVRLRTTHKFGNVLQKGQATVSGGSYKLQIPRGKVQCWFRGSAGSVLVSAPRAINDGRWHTVHCLRTRAGVSLAIDGVTVAGRRGATGRIDNRWPLSIGGKVDCDQVKVGCDYFAGDVDWVEITAIDHGW